MSIGCVFAVVGPSGAGKDTLIDGLRASAPGLHVVRRVITRPGEAGGEPFEGTSEDDFTIREARGDFAVTWMAHGLRYAIPHSELSALARGSDVLFNGSRAALPAVRAVFPDLRVILVTAPRELLADRLAARGRESRAEIAARLDRGAFLLPPDIVPILVVNDGTVAEGIARLRAALHAARGTVPSA